MSVVSTALFGFVVTVVVEVSLSSFGRETLVWAAVEKVCFGCEGFVLVVPAEGTLDFELLDTELSGVLVFEAPATGKVDFAGRLVLLACSLTGATVLLDPLGVVGRFAFARATLTWSL